MTARPQPPSEPAEGPELIWLRPERAGRGPRPAHTRASIAAAAVAVADAEGLDAASMRRVAAAIGAGTMSLYNYVPKREQLLDLMLDAVAGEYDFSEPLTGDPHADLTRLIHHQRAILRRHPWVPRLVIGRPSLGPNGLRYTERFLACLAGTHLTGTEKMETLALLNGLLCQFAEWENAAGSTAKWQADVATYLTEAVMSGGYPQLAAALTAAPASPPPDPDAVFARTLDKLLTALLAES